jgi:hypothetical protein
MDDNKVVEMTRLKLAYQKQVVFIAGMILVALIGLMLYIITIYDYDFPLLISAIVLMATGVIGIMSIDQKMKAISKRIKEL